ncbi:hypothetical protein D3C78_1272260 [compost metagenome]
MTEPPGVSVIIPCWHDEAPLARLLGQLAACPPPLQVVVVDAAQSAACRLLCRQHGALWLASRPCRGAQLRQGAAQASYAALWFLHADAELCGDPLAELRAALGAGAAGGYFAFRFAGAPPWQGRLLAWLVNRRTGVGVPYGDQGLFAARSAYFAAGQHAPWPLFEEVPLVRGLRRLGAFRRLGPGVLVDPRRWQRDGWWRRALRNRLLALGFALGVPPASLARRYRTRRGAS